MKKSVSVFAVLISSFFLIFARDDGGIIFNSSFKPNTIYNISTDTKSSSEMRFIASPYFLKLLKERGLKNPVSYRSDLKVNESVTTGAMLSDSTFPIEIEIKNIDRDISANGEKLNQNVFGALTGLKVTGRYNRDHIIKNIKIYGDSLGVDIKKFLSRFIQNMTGKIKYPARPLYVGDSFKQVIPMQMPVFGNIKMNMNIITDYTLKKVEKDSAYFDIVNHFVINQKSDQFTVDMNGGGHGKLVYDINKSFAVSRKSDTKMQMNIQMDSLKIVSEMISHTQYRVN